MWLRLSNVSESFNWGHYKSQIFTLTRSHLPFVMGEEQSDRNPFDTMGVATRASPHLLIFGLRRPIRVIFSPEEAVLLHPLPK